jgi:hypothetical protein
VPNAAVDGDCDALSWECDVHDVWKVIDRAEVRTEAEAAAMEL